MTDLQHNTDHNELNVIFDVNDFRYLLSLCDQSAIHYNSDVNDGIHDVFPKTDVFDQMSGERSLMNDTQLEGIASYFN